jgi:hypothetical protein
MNCRLELDGRVWTVRLASGRVQVQPGEPATAAVSLRTQPKTLSALLADPATLATACADGSVAVVGDLSAIDRLLHAVADPWPSGDQPASPEAGTAVSVTNSAATVPDTHGAAHAPRPSESAAETMSAADPSWSATAAVRRR